MNAKHLVEALRAADHEPYSYSGRAMYGDRCVAVDLDSTGDIFTLGVAVGRALEEAGVASHHIRAPRTDSMGRGIVAYWPDFEWSPEFAGEGSDEDEMDPRRTGFDND